MRRFTWEQNEKTRNRKSTALRFLNVLNVQAKGVDVSPKNTALSLLSINMTDLNDQILLSLIFAGNAKIMLAVEALEIELRDLGAAWAASRQPNHGK